MKRALFLAAAFLIALAAFFLVLDLNAETIKIVLLHFPGIDKPAHFVEFGLIFALLYLLAGPFVPTDGKRVAAAAIVALALSLLDEFQQRWFGSRSFEIADLLANLTGILFAVAVIHLRRINRRLAVAAGAIALTCVTALTWLSYREERHYKRGLLYESRREYALARESYLLAIEGGNRSPGLYNSLAWVMLESGADDAEAALAYAAEAFSMRPDEPDVLDTYGWALVRAGRPAEALPHLQRVLDARSGMFCIHYHLGMAYLALGEEDLARRHLRRQIEVAPEASEAGRARDALDSIGAAAGAGGPPGDGVPENR